MDSQSNSPSLDDRIPIEWDSDEDFAPLLVESDDLYDGDDDE
jgi:hypothetical protein